MDIVHQIAIYQQICVSSLLIDGVKIHSPHKICDKLKLSRNIRNVYIRNCCLSPAFYANIIAELHNCKHAKELQLSGSLGVPREIGDALSTMMGLKYIYLSRCLMTSEVSAAVLSGLSHCCELQDLNLSRNTWTNCLENLTPKGSPALLYLRSLILQESELSDADVKHLGRVLHSCRLEMLCLTGNNLSGCLQLLCQANLSELKDLFLSGCKLIKADIVLLSERLMPKLKSLDLSDNTLTDCLFDLLGEDSRLASLSSLNLNRCELSSADVKLLGIAGLNGKLRNIKLLDISDNNLANLTEDLFRVSEIPCFSELALSLYG